MQRGICHLIHRITREVAGVDVLELLAVVGQEPLRDELEQYRVIALESRINIEVLPQPHEPVFGHISRPSTRFPRVLARVEGVPNFHGITPCRKYFYYHTS